MVKRSRTQKGNAYLFKCDRKGCPQEISIVVHRREDAEDILTRRFGWAVFRRFLRRAWHSCHNCMGYATGWVFHP